MTSEDAPSISDQVMSALLRMFSTSGKAGGVQEDALLAVSTLVEGKRLQTDCVNFYNVVDTFQVIVKILRKNA